MKKKILALVLVLALVASIAVALVACDDNKKIDEGPGVTIGTKVNVDPIYDEIGDLTGKSIKVGVIMIGDRNESYSDAHIKGIEAAVENIKKVGGNVEIVWKPNLPDTNKEGVQTAANELIADGCQLIISNSYGHQEIMLPTAQKNPNITFIAMTGDTAASTSTANLKNAFNYTFQSRYVAGVVAGMKLKQLVDDNLLSSNNFDGNGNIKLGYVGAYDYAEVVSGYTAFYLGVKSVVSNVAMSVQYTNSWHDQDGEYNAAKSLISQGCVIISQHADSYGAPIACEEAYNAGTRVYCVGYNVDMTVAAPSCAITSATNDWSVYYTYALATALKGETIDTDWAHGYDRGSVAITDINGKLFKEDPSAYVKTVVDKIKSGELQVFDCSKFTVSMTRRPNDKEVNQGATTDDKGYLTSYMANVIPDENFAGDTNAIVTKDGVTYFAESVERSAPYFDVRIDGITELN